MFGTVGTLFSRFLRAAALARAIRTGWRRSGRRRARLEAEQRAADDARGRKPGQRRNPNGGRPYKREYGEPDEKAQSNFTDPESRIMKTSSEGFQQSYNAQTVVEGENQLVVDAGVTNNASDQGQLIPMIDGAAEVCGETPGQALADAGYGNEQDLRELEERGVDGYVALGREGQGARQGRSARVSRGIVGIRR